MEPPCPGAQCPCTTTPSKANNSLWSVCFGSGRVCVSTPKRFVKPNALLSLVLCWAQASLSKLDGSSLTAIWTAGVAWENSTSYVTFSGFTTFVLKTLVLPAGDTARSRGLNVIRDAGTADVSSCRHVKLPRALSYNPTFKNDPCPPPESPLHPFPTCFSP